MATTALSPMLAGPEAGRLLAFDKEADDSDQGRLFFGAGRPKVLLGQLEAEQLKRAYLF